MFDKMKCIGNIYFLSKEQGKKIGDIEKQAGVSAGYISRLNKEDSSTNPGIEFLAAIANELSVSLDALINYDFEAITPTEEYLIKVVERLLSQTEYNEMVWKRDNERDLHSSSVDQLHPLFEKVSHLNKIGKECSEIVYKSQFLPEEKVVIAGDGYWTTLSGSASVYLMKVLVEPKDDETPLGYEAMYELYLVQDCGTEPLCYSGKYMDTTFASVLKNLYEAVVESGKHAKIKPEVKSVLDAFMNGTDEQLFN